MLKEDVQSIRIQFFGNILLYETNIKLNDSEQNFSIPIKLNFNSSWRVNHKCLNCDNEVAIIEDFEKPFRNYSTIKGIDTKNRSYRFLKEVVDLFPNLEIVKIDNAYYVNRTDVKYEYDLQRKSSTELKHHNCEICKTNYLSFIRIGYPIEAEKGKLAFPGMIEVIQISKLEKEHYLIKNLIK